MNEFNLIMICLLVFYGKKMIDISLKSLLTSTHAVPYLLFVQDKKCNFSSDAMQLINKTAECRKKDESHSS